LWALFGLWESCSASVPSDGIVKRKLVHVLRKQWGRYQKRHCCVPPLSVGALLGGHPLR
jgi:hypothetical protein